MIPSSLPTQSHDSALDRNKYESMLQEVINQLSLTIERKHEDIDQLNRLRERALIAIHTSRKIVERFTSFKETVAHAVEAADMMDSVIHLESLMGQNRREMDDTVTGINEMIANINECIMIESQFIQGTNTLLKDVVRYVVSSYANLSQLQAYDQSIIETVKSPLLVLDHGLKVVSANRACFETFGVTAKQLVGSLYGDIVGEHGGMPNAPELKHRLHDVIEKNIPVNDFEMVMTPSNSDDSSTASIFLINAHRLRQPKPAVSGEMLLISIENVTERRETERQLTRALEQMKRINLTLKQKNESWMSLSISQAMIFRSHCGKSTLSEIYYDLK